MAAAPTVTFAPSDRVLGAPEVEVGAHAEMSTGFDSHMHRRGDIDRCLAHLSLAVEGLRVSVEGLAAPRLAALGDSGSVSPRGQAKREMDQRMHAQLGDEVALLDAQISAASKLSSARQTEIHDLKAVLGERRSVVRNRYATHEIKQQLGELSDMEEKIRAKEDELLELTRIAAAREASRNAKMRDLRGEGEELRQQRNELRLLAEELERQNVANRQATDELKLELQQLQQSSPSHGSASGQRKSPSNSSSSRLHSPSHAGAPPGIVVTRDGGVAEPQHLVGGVPPEVANASDTELLLRQELAQVARDIDDVNELLTRDGLLLPDGSPRERLLNREYPDAGLSREMLISIMQLLKANLFNVSVHIDMIEGAVKEIIEERERHRDDPERWGREQVMKKLLKAVQAVRSEEYRNDVEAARNMERRLRGLVLLCDTVDGVTAAMIVENATRLGVAVDVAQLYVVAMECKTLIREERHRRQLIEEERRLQRRSSTKGRALASVGRMSFSTHRPSVSSRTGSTANNMPYVDSDDGLNVDASE